MIKVTLHPAEVEWADHIAQLRRNNACEAGRQPAHGAPENYAEALQLDIDGARAEMAGKVALNPIRWHAYRAGRQRDLDPDLCDFIDVKGCPGPQVDRRGNLILTHRSRDSWAYPLIWWGDHPDYSVVGWCWGYEGKQARYRWRGAREGGGGWLIRYDDPIIKPIEELRQIHQTWPTCRCSTTT